LQWNISTIRNLILRKRTIKFERNVNNLPSIQQKVIIICIDKIFISDIDFHWYVSFVCAIIWGEKELFVCLFEWIVYITVLTIWPITMIHHKQHKEGIKFDQSQWYTINNTKEGIKFDPFFYVAYGVSLWLVKFNTFFYVVYGVSLWLVKFNTFFCVVYGVSLWLVKFHTFFLSGFFSSSSLSLANLNSFS
jgi:hypothetical protein